MKSFNLVQKSLLFVAASCVALLTFPSQANTWNTLNNKATLRAFSSEEELSQWLTQKKEEHDEYIKSQQGRLAYKIPSQYESDALMASVAEPSPVAAQKSMNKSSEDESVTNTQTAGVDEGGIVKVHGDHLVILRRGRLFTIDVQGKNLTPVSTVNAFAPGTSGNAWYDEMLVSGNTVVVIGYSYAKGGTEVVLFDIDRSGQLNYRSTYVLRSNDYYSSRNYASRLIGNKLIFYTPLYLNFRGNPLDCFPAMRHWQPNKAYPNRNSDFKPLAPATQIYRASDDLDPLGGLALHTVQVCDLSTEPMSCKASGVLGPAGREFYVSQDAVYIWTAPQRYRRDVSNNQPVNSAVFRLPLDSSSAPTALKTLGGPIDQFSFLENDGYLDVFLRAEGPSASMWASEIGSSNLALLRVSLNDFGDGTTSAPTNQYYPLPQPTGGHSIQNRYIDDFLVYGSGTTWRRAATTDRQPKIAYLMNYRFPRIQPVELPIDHSVDRIEALGNYPLMVGTKGGDLHFSTISAKVRASTDSIEVAQVGEYRLEGAAQGETRSHGFFYKPSDESNGILGLPFQGSGRGGWSQLKKVSNGIVYLGNTNLKLNDLGILASSPSPNTNDHCQASCTDWYGNSRPLFIKGRVFALMGYELVEGKIVRGKIIEEQRLDFTPKGNKTR